MNENINGWNDNDGLIKVNTSPFPIFASHLHNAAHQQTDEARQYSLKTWNKKVKVTVRTHYLYDYHGTENLSTDDRVTLFFYS